MSKKASTSQESREKRRRIESAYIGKDLPMRKFKKIPIFIVEQHNDVLQFIYRCFGGRHLPLLKNAIIHFDSHPDMVIPHDLEPDVIFKRHEIIKFLSIENWLMPTCYAGHFNKLIWVKNSWCKQIDCGNYNFNIGDFNSEIFVDLPTDYFVSEGNYCITEKLENMKEINFKVIEIDDPAISQSDEEDEKTTISQETMETIEKTMEKGDKQDSDKIDEKTGNRKTIVETTERTVVEEDELENDIRLIVEGEASISEKTAEKIVEKGDKQDGDSKSQVEMETSLSKKTEETAGKTVEKEDKQDNKSPKKEEAGISQKTEVNTEKGDSDCKSQIKEEATNSQKIEKSTGKTAEKEDKQVKEEVCQRDKATEEVIVKEDEQKSNSEQMGINDNLKDINQFIAEANYILDIDLDYFSCIDPFIDIYDKANCYDKLKDIFDYKIDKDHFERDYAKRRTQINNLEEIFQHLDKCRRINMTSNVFTRMDSELMRKVVDLIKSIKDHYPDDDIDWMLIYNAGCTTDNDGLPQHISSDRMLNVYFKNFENFIKSINRKPTAITISRSSEDGYCPIRKVEYIQENVLKILSSVYGDSLTSKPVLWYENPLWDISDL